MKNRNKVLIVVAFLFLGFVVNEGDIYFRINKSIDIFGRVYKEIVLNYVDEINPENFMLAGIRGMLGSLDPYTVFIDETRQKDLDVITNGKYGGIGATVGLQNGKAVIMDLLEGYPAQRQGLRVGDIILEVDSIKITKENYPELGKYLKRKPGTEIRLTIQREGEKEPLIFNIFTEEIQLKNLTFYSLMGADSSTAYLKLSGFTRNAGGEVKNALLELKEKHELKGIILDLRGNPGGLLDAAVDVAEKFLPKGSLIVSVKGRNKESYRKIVSREEPVAGDIPMAVLIDGNSASASEIVAGAMQDHDRAVVVGTRSFGKGLVQTIVPLSYNTSLKLTTARYYTPSGRCIQKVDYSKNKKIFAKDEGAVQKEFRTEHGRIVFSAGGIMPDTVVENSSDSEILRDLLAKGYFFKFATHYFNANTPLDLQNLDENKIFGAFVNYLDSSNFVYKSNAEKRLEALEEAVEQDKPLRYLKNRLEDLKQELASAKRKELSEHKSEIVNGIKEELARRISGRKGRIIESLKHDKQFVTALSILSDRTLYEKLLNLE